MTIREHLEALPEPIKSQALANLESKSANDPALSTLDAIGGGFSWSNTPEGFSYWLDVCANLPDDQCGLEDKDRLFTGNHEN